MSRWGMPLGGVGALTLVLLAQAGVPPLAQIPIRIDFEAPAGCADADAFYAGVLARMNRVRHAHARENAMRLVVRLTRTGGKVHGELRVSGEGGESDTRRVDGATCEEVVQVLSLTAALAIDPSTGPSAGPSAGPSRAAGAPAIHAKPPVVAASPPSRPSPPPVTAGSPSPATPSPPPPTPTPTPTSTPAPPAPATSPRSESPSPPGSPPAPVEPPSIGAAPVAPPADSSPPAPPWSPRTPGWELGAALVAAEVVSPSLSAGAGVSLRFGITTRDQLTPSVALSLLFLPADFQQSGDDVSVRFTAVAVAGCPGWTSRTRVEIEPCARVTGGLLTATDHSVTNPRSADRSWWSLGALVRATSRLGTSGFTLELAGGIDVPLVKRSFIVTTVPQRSVGDTPTVSPTVSLAVGRSL